MYMLAEYWALAVPSQSLVLALFVYFSILMFLLYNKD